MLFRSNFTNLHVTPANFICQNPHFVKSALSRYPAPAFIDLVERHGLAYETRALGKLFCAERASDLIEILKTECDWAGVEIQLSSEIESVRFESGRYSVKTANGIVSAPKLVVATGALSFPKLKATGLGYEIAQQFGLRQIPTSPGLVPLSFDGKWQARFSELSGLSMEVTASANGQAFKEAMLFTHKGLSGPAILQVSNYWKMGQALELNLFPEIGRAHV